MLKIVDVNGDTQEVEVIRYFQLNSNNYLLYSLGEKDEQNYVKLYGNKVESQQGVEISEDEWGNVKDEIKKIIKGNKEGNLEVADLNFKEINGVVIKDSRAFKLSSELVDLLKANKKEFAEEQAEAAPVQEEQPQETAPQDFDLGLETEGESNEAEVETPQPEEAPQPEIETPQPEEAPQPEVETPQPEEAPQPEVETPQPEMEAPQPSEMPQPEAVADIQPEPVGSVEEEIEENKDYEQLYKEAQEVQKVLKAEIDDLKAKLSKIAQTLGE